MAPSGGAGRSLQISSIGLFVYRHQLRAGLLAGFEEPLGAFRRMQPGIVAEPRSGCEILFDPGGWRRVDDIDQREDRGVGLFARLQGVAAIREQNGLVGQHDQEAGRAGKAGQPGQPFLAVGQIFVLVLVGARHDEAGQLAARQLLAERAESGRQRHAAFGFFERLEMGFEHRRDQSLDVQAHIVNAIAPRFGIIHALQLVLSCARSDGTVCHAWPFGTYEYLEEFQECFNSTKRGCTMPAFTFEKISPPENRRARSPLSQTRSSAASSSRCSIVSRSPRQAIIGEGR